MNLYTKSIFMLAGLFIRDNLKFTLRIDLTTLTNEFEGLWIEIRSDDVELFIDILVVVLTYSKII